MDNQSQKEIVQFVWPLECNNTNVTVGNCASAEVLSNIEFWKDISIDLNISTSIDDIFPDFQCKFNEL